jgi:hypothetical protein
VERKVDREFAPRHQVNHDVKHTISQRVVPLVNSNRNDEKKRPRAKSPTSSSTSDSDRPRKRDMKNKRSFGVVNLKSNLDYELKRQRI